MDEKYVIFVWKEEEEKESIFVTGDKVWEYVQEHRDTEYKFSIYRLSECLLDFS